MGFEPNQQPSKVESVNEFKDRMASSLEEARSALAKAKDDMAKYYDRHRTPAPEYKAGDKVYLDTSDIQTTWPSQKLSHKFLGPFTIAAKLSNNAYCLALPASMSRLHPVFNVVKLSPAPATDPIPGQRVQPPRVPTIIAGEPEWEIDKVLDSRV